MTDELPIIAAEVAECTKKDSVLVKVYEYTSSGWPGSCPHPELKLCWKMDTSKGEEVSSYHSNSTERIRSDSSQLFFRCYYYFVSAVFVVQCISVLSGAGFGCVTIKWVTGSSKLKNNGETTKK